jgi:hypothetical protein
MAAQRTLPGQSLELHSSQIRSVHEREFGDWSRASQSRHWAHEVFVDFGATQRTKSHGPDRQDCEERAVTQLE